MSEYSVINFAILDLDVQMTEIDTRKCMSKCDSLSSDIKIVSF